MGAVVGRSHGGGVAAVQLVHRQLGEFGAETTVDEQGSPDLDDRRIASRPLAELARRAPGQPVLDPAERMLGHPFGADLLRRDFGIKRLVRGLEPAAVCFVHTVAPRGGPAVDEGGIFTWRRVAVVAEQVHRFMIAEHDHDFTALARRLPLQLLQAADDLERVRPAVGDVAELDERGLAAGPVTLRVDQPGGAGNGQPRLIVAVEVADGDDALGLRSSR